MTSLTDLRALCAEMKELQDRKAVMDTEVTELNKAIDELRLRKIPAMMEELEVKNATFEGLGRVQLATDLYASTKEGQKEAAIQWLRDLGYENMVTETYNATSLKALFRRQLEQGIEIPDEIFNVNPFIRASIVKA